jgi:TonB family protein
VERRGGAPLGPLPALAMTPPAAVMGTAAGSALRRVAVAAPAVVVAVVAGWYAYTRVEAGAARAPETQTVPGQTRPASIPAPAAAAPEPRIAPAQDRPLKAVREKPPVYPELARTAHVEGVVRLAVVVGPDGAVRRVSVRSGHPLLIPAALDAVRQWAYQPAREKGRPVESQTNVEVRFALKR